MPVFRKQTTKPIPPGAERILVKGVPHIRYRGRGGKAKTARLSEDGNRILLESAKWYGTIPGRKNPVPLSTNKSAAEMMLGDLLKKAEMGRAGCANPYQDHQDTPLSRHLEDYLAELSDCTREHREGVNGYLKALFKGCGFSVMGDIDATRVLRWLEEQRRDREPVEVPPGEGFRPCEVAQLLGLTTEGVNSARWRLDLPPGEGKGKKRRYPRSTVLALARHQARGIGPRTSNYYLATLKAFCSWLVRAGRMERSPVSRLEPLSEKEDIRHSRRELSREELTRLLTITRASTKVLRGLTGEDRFHLYALAVATAFRVGALASLTPGHFFLDEDPPYVLLTARASKNRKRKEQPLNEDMVALFRLYLKGRDASRLLWPGTWSERAVDVLRKDLRAAGIAYRSLGPEGPLYADAHALRHTCLSLLGRAGVDLRTLQEIAHHSTPTLTARYVHKHKGDVAAGLAKLPKLTD